MTNAPEHITVYHSGKDSGGVIVQIGVAATHFDQYTRTDLYTAACEERDALRAALADLCDKATSYGSQMGGVTETFNSICALNDMAASVRAARDLLSKGTPND
jgi:hypothetical protein